MARCVRMCQPGRARPRPSCLRACHRRGVQRRATHRFAKTAKCRKNFLTARVFFARKGPTCGSIRPALIGLARSRPGGTEAPGHVVRRILLRQPCRGSPYVGSPQGRGFYDAHDRSRTCPRRLPDSAGCWRGSILRPIERWRGKPFGFVRPRTVRNEAGCLTRQDA